MENKLKQVYLRYQTNKTPDTDIPTINVKPPSKRRISKYCTAKFDNGTFELSSKLGLNDIVYINEVKNGLDFDEELQKNDESFKNRSVRDKLFYLYDKCVEFKDFQNGFKDFYEYMASKTKLQFIRENSIV